MVKISGDRSGGERAPLIDLPPEDLEESLAEETDSEGPSKARAIGRFLLLLLLLGLGAAALRWTPLGSFLNQQRLVAYLEEIRHASWAPLLLIGLFTVLSPIGMPSTPLLAGGAIVFGPFWGSVYNFIGSFLGAVTSYYLARGLARDLVLRLVGHHLARFGRLLDRHGFWAVVRVRFLPIPFPIMNYGPALLGIPPPTFLAATALGLIIPIPIWTYFWASLFGAAASSAATAGRNVALALGLFLLLSFLPRLWLGRQRRQRLRGLRQIRQDRQPQDSPEGPSEEPPATPP